jgi:8-oxo-dGTP pyrophosphatase MutT (NUDIX family)
VFTLKQIRDGLTSYIPDEVVPNQDTRQAAVAIVMRHFHNQPQVLFIQRSEKEGDPWSGHMAFPGGHRESHDADLLSAAVRETDEEIGLDLAGGSYLGALDHQHANPRGRVLNMLVAPHVFEIDGDPDFSPNHEVAEVVWASLDELAVNALHDTETRPMAGVPTVFNGYRLERGHFVWGLTYRILKSLFIALDPNWTPPREL